MCTVTYFPQENGFILTSNRDEHISRKPSSPIEIDYIKERKVIFPRDNEANGTWIIASENGRLVCLLNGGFQKHKRVLPYRKSRGIVVRELFELDSFKFFIDNYNLEKIEPFTLAWVENNGKELYDFKWDGKEKWFQKLNSSNPNIWSSSTLYSDDLKIKREEWLEDWFQNQPDYTPIKILDFHSNAGDGNLEYSTKMKRSNGVQTVSITQVIGSVKEFNMRHINFSDSSESKMTLDING